MAKNQRPAVPRQCLLGVSLLELLVGLAVGLLVIAAAGAFLLTITRMVQDRQAHMRLAQELSTIIKLISNDVRRSGYWSGASAGLGTHAVNPFMRRASAGATTDVVVSDGCILYTYDATFVAGHQAGVVNNQDLFGFRWHAPSETLQILVDSPDVINTAVACDALRWQGLTDPNEIKLREVRFVASYSCHQAGAAAHIQASACTEPGAMEVRTVTLTLQAAHASRPEVALTLSQTVLLPNHRWVPAS